MYAKVFGERNTGTNFVNKLISRNTDLKVLLHGSNSVPESRSRELSKSFRLGMLKSSMLDKLVLDRLIDQQREEEYPDNYGWKHARVLLEDLSRSPKKDSTIFIFLVRNPWRFVSALHKRPYNLFPSPPRGLIDFVDSCFLANARDRMPCNFVENPVQFWNLKVESYFECNAALSSSIICYYEDIVRSPHGFLDSLRPFCNVQESTTIPMESTKKDDMTFDDYRSEALAYNPVKELGEEVYRKVLGNINKELLSKTIYAVHSP